MPVEHAGHESLVQLWAAKGAIGAGAVGAVAGFIFAWTVNASTAWFGIIEVGVPAFVLGAIAGAASGAVASASRRHHSRRDTGS